MTVTDPTAVTVMALTSWMAVLAPFVAVTVAARLRTRRRMAARFSERPGTVRRPCRRDPERPVPAAVPRPRQATGPTPTRYGPATAAEPPDPPPPGGGS